MNIESAVGALRRALDARLPIMLWGPPGVGKSSLVREEARERELDLIDLRLAQLDATDLRGIPVPDKKNRLVDWYRPAFLPADGRGILFLDEIDKAPNLVKNAALQLVLDRRLGDYKLPEGWQVVAAGNREEDNAYGTGLGSALANRLLHVEVEADIDAWAKWAKAKDIHEDVISFLRFRSELLYKMTGENAFPSPRSWEAASNLLKGDRHASPAVIACAVGGGTASEFVAWVKLYRDVEVERIVNGEIPNFEKRAASFRYAVVLSVASYIEKNRLTESNFQAIGDLLKAVTPELRVLLLKSVPANMVAQLAAHPAVREAASKVVMDYLGE
ncbi:MAG: ATPase [Elusimicrobia bacterium CG_4_9_14_3_um_filter_62_55]|nr:MAG: ATPase [Elusimicrobia bacterium CG22_combo_CG10-13_8_21_14_all_63_91]PJA13297.1 MAG: ATPase [Elusimicrobia bacterium CG_4_10_14_0_2_um_filter_63_34]PJB26129.1 MAG: ATPase [Elusimicrobia bacterium CG_4_9_14_3_um_filter_62_55]